MEQSDFYYTYLTLISTLRSKCQFSIRICNEFNSYGISINRFIFLHLNSSIFSFSQYGALGLRLVQPASRCTVSRLSHVSLRRNTTDYKAIHCLVPDLIGIEKTVASNCCLTELLCMNCYSVSRAHTKQSCSFMEYRAISYRGVSSYYLLNNL